MRKLLTGIVLSAFLAQACASSSEPNVGVSRSELKRYSGKDLYNAILFNAGPARGLVPAVGSYVDESIKVSDERAAELARLTEKLNTENPEFFAGFARAIGSGDRVAIHGALQQAVELTAKTAERSGRVSKEQREKIVAEAQERRLGGANRLAIDPAVDIEVFIYAVAVLLVFVIDFTPLQGNAQDQIVLEAIADDIARL